jgi:hypothetical protein
MKIVTTQRDTEPAAPIRRRAAAATPAARPAAGSRPAHRGAPDLDGDVPTSGVFAGALNAGIHDDDTAPNGGHDDVAPNASAHPEDARRGAATAIPEDLRARFEQALGTGLGGVRVHTDGPAERAATSFGAAAFAQGDDVYFGAGRYGPHTPEGAHLLAHEAAHTVQRRGDHSSNSPSASSATPTRPRQIAPPTRW